MRKIVYYVASSIDGYICGPNEDISGFVQSGDGVEKYLKDLLEFDTVIMGRKTYEFGYKFGLEPGQPAYPHMDHFIFSTSLKIENMDEKVNICELDLDIIKRLKEGEGTDIYLCGGGEFAGWLLDNDLIDVLKVKLNPFIMGDGVKMFEGNKNQIQLDLIEQQTFEKGLQIITYNINY